VKDEGAANDLFDRLKSDQAFAGVDLEGALDARKFIGRAPEQVATFVRDVVDPILTRHRADLDVTRGDVRV
jgi:adenylosuccinate lyase